MSDAKAKNVDGLIQGKCMVTSISLLVLFDSGLTHSFVSVECVDILKLQTESLPFDLVVSTSTSVSVVLSTFVSRYPVVVNANHVMLNYSDKTVVFGGLSEISDEGSDMKLLSAKGVKTSFKEGGFVFVLLASLEGDCVIDCQDCVIDYTVLDAQPKIAISRLGETTLAQARILQYSPGFHPPRFSLERENLAQARDSVF
ncbi:hypothetical protein Lal_00012034 [Lupinus albus]|nr:hypothetical protein Lal_00012034 [Lupinus albus]